MKTILSFLRHAHFLHGFLGCLIVFNAVSMLIMSIAVEPSDERSVALLSMLFVSLVFSPAIGFSWDAIEAQSARWKKQGEDEDKHREFMLEKAWQMNVFYRPNPDFLAAAAQSSIFITLYVKAAPHGHPFPHDWDGVPVMIVVKSPESWASFDAFRKVVAGAGGDSL